MIVGPVWNKVVDRFDKGIGETRLPKFSKTAVWVAAICSLPVLVVTASIFGYRHFHKVSATTATAPAPVPPKPAPAPAAPPVQASTQQPQQIAPPPRKPRSKPAAPPAPATTVGTGSTVYGNVPPGTRVGGRSVYVGATEANGSTRIGGGTAIGYGASADPTSIAIGAHAGSHPQPPATVNSAPNGFVVSGGTVNNPTVNNYTNPAPMGPNNVQLADSAKDIARRFRELQDYFNWHDNNERQAHANGQLGPIPRSFYQGEMIRLQPIRTEAMALRRVILDRVPPQPTDDDCKTVLDYNSLAGVHPLYGCADYFEHLAQSLMLK